MYVFLDESGHFRGSSGIFVVGGFTTSDPRKTAKAFRKWQHSKFSNKKLRYRTEIKFSDTRLTNELRIKTFLNFVRQDIHIFYTFLKKENIPLEFQKHKGLESGYLYTEIVAETLRVLFPTTDHEFRVFLDRRHLKGISQAQFRRLLKVDLLPRLPVKAILQIETIDSTTNPNIQIADWICGALYRYYTNGECGKEFYSILYNSILASEELFKNYWDISNQV